MTDVVAGGFFHDDVHVCRLLVWFGNGMQRSRCRRSICSPLGASMNVPGEIQDTTEEISLGENTKALLLSPLGIDRGSDNALIRRERP